MRYPIYQVDAFTNEIFKGNPAAVMPLDAWLPDETRLEARQLSSRGGLLRCELKGDRVAIAGQAAFYMEGTVHLE